MSRTYLKDATYRILGVIDTNPNGTKVAMDSVFRVVGTYYPSQDITKDFYGKFIGTGDHLSALIYKANNL